VVILIKIHMPSGW